MVPVQFQWMEILKDKLKCKAASHCSFTEDRVQALSLSEIGTVEVKEGG